MAKVRQYSSAEPFYGYAKPALAVSEEDKARLSAYHFYEDAYHNRPEAFELTIRGDEGDSEPIYLPSAKKIIEATNRFLAINFEYLIGEFGDDAAKARVNTYMRNLFRREGILQKFINNKRYLLIRGDSLFHITADDTKPEGRRISVHELHPGNYFPIEDPNNVNRLLGCHICEIVKDPRDAEKEVVKRQTYRRVVDDDGNPTGRITSELSLWEMGAWDDRTLEPGDLKKVSSIKDEFELPEQITTVPVYHVKNNPLPGETFGNSQLSGIETVMRAINQSATDEDLTLVMQGLGMYWTNAGPPQNDDGSTAPWNLGPGQVVEVGEGQQFGRVTGVSSVAPFTEHMTFIDGYALNAIGIPEIATGKVDVQVAESGIALKFQLSPILAANGEKEGDILMESDHMLWDITHQWMPAFEGIDFPEVEVVSVVGDPVPQNREAAIQEVLLLFTSGVVPLEIVHAKLKEFGYELSAGDVQKVIEQQRKLAIAKNGDPWDNRFGEETENTGGE